MCVLKSYIIQEWKQKLKEENKYLMLKALGENPSFESVLVTKIKLVTCFHILLFCKRSSPMVQNHPSPY